MIQETDISQEKQQLSEVRVNRILKNLQKRNMNGKYVANCQEALSAVLEMIPPGTTVARGDSVTLFQLGIMPALIKRGQNKIIDPFQQDAEGRIPRREQRRVLQREALLSDIFLTSTNAITLDGKLVNIDGAGNRVAAMIFGPKKVIVVAGINKIVIDVDTAFNRIHNICTPTIAIRHKIKHGDPEIAEVPCAKTGKCVDCNHEWRGCRYSVVIEGAMIPEKDRIHVLLVGEELGV
jgi:hypothetical protein